MIVTDNIATDPTTGKPVSRQSVKADKALLANGPTITGQLFHPPKLSTDTVKFLIRQRPDKARRTSMKQALMATGCTYVRWHKTAAEQYHHRLEIQDPTDDTYRRLASLLPGNRFVGRDLAVDFPAITTQPLTAAYMAEILAYNMNHIMTQRHRGGRKTNRYKTTIYGAARKTGPAPTARLTARNWRCYPAQNGEPIVRFEAIYNGADLCKRRGLWTASDLIGPKGDPVKWLMQDFRISIISMKRYDNVIKREARNIVRSSDKPRPTVAAVEEQLRTEVFIALQQSIRPGETLDDLTVQDHLDAHPLLREAAEHTGFFDLSASRARARARPGQ